MAEFKRVILVIAEGLGLGAAPDAAEFADNGADTLGHLFGPASSCRLYRN